MVCARFAHYFVWIFLCTISLADQGPALAPTIIRAWNFGLDDNIFLLPAKVYLYKNITNQELALETSEYSDAKRFIGKKGKWKGYHLNRNTGLMESFREFQDQVGRNVFLEQIKEALKYPPYKWQGRSFNALVEALKKNESAKWTTIFTSRQHSAEHLREGFLYLKQLGYIDNVPPLENFFSTSTPEIRAKFGIGDEESIRAKILESILDRIQKTPLLNNVFVTDSTGRGMRAMHQLGFSDNDYTNLLEVIRSLKSDKINERWPDVKISVFNTGKGGKGLDRGLYIFNNETGKLRKIIKGEQSQIMGNATSVFGGDVAPTGEVLKKGTKPPGNIGELAIPIVVKSPLETVESSIEKMYLSHPFKNSSSQLKAGADLFEINRGKIEAFIQDSTFPNSKKKILVTHYDIKDPEIVDLLISAKERGVSVLLTTDLNLSMDFVPNGEEKFSSNFTDFKNNESARQVKRLLDSGFKLNDPKFGIYSQPLYPTGAINPNMHEKSILLVGDGKALDYLDGTFNFSSLEHYDRLVEFSDEQIAKYALDHAEALMEAFSMGGEIKDIEDIPPLRVTYNKDDSYLELAFTNGRYNPNQRIVDLLNFSRANPSQMEIKEVVFSHFIFTNKNIQDSLRLTMEAQKNFKVFGIFDQKFIKSYGYGLAEVFAGFDVIRPMGGTIEGYSTELTERMELKIYDGTQGKDFKMGSSGRPKETYWHDKTTIIRTIENGEEWSYIYFGSLNPSNHASNADSQFCIRIRSNSEFAQGMKNSILEVAHSSPQVVSFEAGKMKKILAELFGVALRKIPIDSAERILNLIHSNQIAAIESEIKKLIAGALQGIEVSAEAKSAVNRLTRMIRWFEKTPGAAIKGFNSGDFGQAVSIAVNQGLIPEEEQARVLKSWADGLKLKDEERLLFFKRMTESLEINPVLSPLFKQPVPCMKILGPKTSMVPMNEPGQTLYQGYFWSPA